MQDQTLKFEHEGTTYLLAPVVDDDGMAWFRASEVCAVTGHKNTGEATRDHVDPDDIAKRYAVDSKGRRSQVIYVNESGMYALALAGRTERCRAFKRWVTSVVLPSIRKTGAYVPQPTHIPNLLAEDFRPWSKTWQDDLMQHLCALKGEVFAGRHPRWAAQINGVIYEAILGREAYRELKRRNSQPSRGHNHHQLIREELKERFDERLRVVGALAAVSTSLTDLTKKLRHVFLREALQLPLLDAANDNARTKRLAVAP